MEVENFEDLLMERAGRPKIVVTIAYPGMIHAQRLCPKTSMEKAHENSEGTS
jgi:hypothetical protein